jgi:hypothetical protein
MAEQGAPAAVQARRRPWIRPRLETLRVDRTAADQDVGEDEICFGGTGVCPS